MMTVFTLAMIPVLRLGGEAIMRLFVNEAPVIEMGASGIVWFMSGVTAWIRYIWYRKKKLEPEMKATSS